ncbi:MAG TPA: hypothetical protein VGO93_09945 [Candidatus Xenobia bacterium]|jgi:hypothetical protein
MTQVDLKFGIVALFFFDEALKVYDIFGPAAVSAPGFLEYFGKTVDLAFFLKDRRVHSIMLKDARVRREEEHRSAPETLP